MFQDRVMTRAEISTLSSLTLSEPLVVDIKVYRGDSGRFRITVSDPVGAPIDVSSATWDADIRKKANDPSIITSFDVEPVTGDTSSVDVVLPANKSQLFDDNCVYDVEMTLSGVVLTLVGGKINVTQDISRP